MKRNQSYVKLTMVAMFIMAAQFAVGSFIGSTTSNERKDRYSLKTLNNRSLLKNYSLSSFSKTNYRFSGSQVVNLQTNLLGKTQVNSIVRFEKGNTSFVFPYKYNAKMPKFKTPSASSFR